MSSEVNLLPRLHSTPASVVCLHVVEVKMYYHYLALSLEICTFTFLFISFLSIFHSGLSDSFSCTKVNVSNVKLQCALYLDLLVLSVALPFSPFSVCMLLTAGCFLTAVCMTLVRLNTLSQLFL